MGAGLSREAGNAVHGTGFAGVRGASPLPQVDAKSIRCSMKAGLSHEPRRSRSHAQRCLLRGASPLPQAPRQNAAPLHQPARR
ncbi:hypothetical protein C1X72_13700 [Pseudomonas sp. FW306-2-2C-D06B]|nr:hypothetical protein C1X72_13700 [Pseudomonas sp. FW306-2-2C-D06B]PNA85696.1 hypothetical protein C1X74_30585 [Pseudomonas sp. GW460-5]PNB53592.1 hypothetical protein C1X73_30575 [Pseudomonas sp. FW305-130]